VRKNVKPGSPPVSIVLATNHVEIEARGVVGGEKVTPM